MDALQKELDGLTTKLDIHILGVNEVGQEAGNDTITNGRDLPWLQDTPQAGVWAAWQVTFRDVVILDQKNYRVTAYNLTQHDLSVAANYAALKQLLIDAANAK